MGTEETVRLDTTDSSSVQIVKSDKDDSPLQKISDGTVRQYASAFIVNMLAFSFGTTVGWMSPVTSLLKGDQSPLDHGINDEELSWMGSLTFLGGLITNMMWGKIVDLYGRKAAGYGVGGCFVVGWSVILFSSWVWALYLGRLILGFSSGCFIVAPLYVTETVKDSLRGTLGSFVILFFNIGVVYTYALGAVLSYRVFTLACLVVPIVFLICYYFLPETPSYLWSINKKKESKDSLNWFRNGNSKLVQEELLQIQATMTSQEPASFMSLFETRANKKATLIGIGLFFFQPFCGIVVIMNYASSIVQRTNSSLPIDLVTILLSLIQLISSVGSAIIADKFGRKTLLIFSYGMMSIALLILGLSFQTELPDWMPFASLSFYFLTYPVGSGPITYVVISEILAPKIRGLATSIFVSWGAVNIFLSVKIFPWLIVLFGYAGCFWFFSVWCVIGTLFTWWLIPESKGIPLDKMLSEMNGEEIIFDANDPLPKV